MLWVRRALCDNDLIALNLIRWRIEKYEITYIIKIVCFDNIQKLKTLELLILLLNRFSQMNESHLAGVLLAVSYK